MKKNVTFKITTVLLPLVMLFLGYSCSMDDNETTYEESAEWIELQEKVLNMAINSKDERGTLLYTYITSESGNGRVYTKPSDYITKNMEGDFGVNPSGIRSLRETQEEIIYRKKPYGTDTVVVRYEAWYYIDIGENNEEDLRVVFDSTERDTNTGESTNNNLEASFRVNSTIDGFKTALMDMEIGEERIICIPYQLGYGIYGDYDLYGNQTIRGYTTLFFDVKLLKNTTQENEIKNILNN